MFCLPPCLEQVQLVSSLVSTKPWFFARLCWWPSRVTAKGVRHTELMYLRRTARMGPLRFSFSKSGVGMSVGFKGLRIGTGPRGNYVHVGGRRVMVRPQSPPFTVASMPPGSSARREPLPERTAGAMTEIDSGSALEMVDASSSALLAELNEKRKRYRFAPTAGILSFPFILVLGFSGAPLWFLYCFAAALAVGCFWVWTLDNVRTTTVIVYDLEEDVQRGYGALHNAFERIRACQRAWHIGSHGQVQDSKYHAGASSLVTRSPVILGTSELPLVRTNVSIPTIPVGAQLFAFMPDRLLVFAPEGIGAVPYDLLKLVVVQQQFIEDETPPPEAQVVGRTWRYVNKSGGPDLRFKENPELPICLYEKLEFTSVSGIHEVVQLSKTGIGQPLADALTSLAQFARTMP
jgi:Protein of unknown function (DUF4236)